MKDVRASTILDREVHFDIERNRERPDITHSCEGEAARLLLRLVFVGAWLGGSLVASTIRWLLAKTMDYLTV
jgi:hypothetical protein